MTSPSHPPAKEIEVDEEVIQHLIDDLNRYVDYLNDVTEQGMSEYDDMRDQLKGDNGEIPPIYQSIAEALSDTGKKFREVNAALTDQLRKDAQILHRIATTHGDIQREAAKKFDEVVGEFSAANGSTPPHSPGNPPHSPGNPPHNPGNPPHSPGNPPGGTSPAPITLE